MSEKCFLQRTSKEIKTWDQWGLDVGNITRNSMFTLGTLKEVPCVLMEDPQGLSEEDRQQFHIFAPLLIPVQPITLEKLLVGALLIKYAKDPKGRGQLKEIAIKYLDVIGDSMRALARASASHWSVAVMNTKVTLRVYKNLGLMTPDEAAGLEVWLNQFVVGLAATDIIGQIGGIGTMVFGGKGVPAFRPPAPGT